jgi:hypothetical protein
VSNVIDLDDNRKTTTLRVTGVGSVLVHSARGESRLRLTLKAAARGSAVLVADEVIVLSTDLSRHQARQLPTPARRRLALAVSRANGWEPEWQALYGSDLSTDERLVASAVWGRRRQWRELRERLRSAAERRTTRQRQVSLGMPATVSASMRAALGINDTLRKVSGPLTAIRMGAGLDRSVNRVALGLQPAVRLPGIVAATTPKLALAGTGLDKLRRIGSSNAAANALAVIGPRPLLLPNTVTQALGIQKAFAGAALHPDLSKQLQTMLGVGAFQQQMNRILAPYRDVTNLQRLLNPLGAVSEELAALGRFLDAWGEDPLWFLLSSLGTRGSWQLVKLNREQVKAALLQALEDVVRDSEYVAALREAVAQASDLTDAEQDHLDHALEHAQRGEWRHALASFHPGFEGAVYQAGLRRRLVAPSRGTKIEAAESLLRRVIGEGEYLVFVIRHVYGGVGNPHRHGRTNTGEREVMLSGIVALAGWIELFMSLPAMEVLVDEIEGRLPAVVEALSGPAQLEPAA